MFKQKNGRLFARMLNPVEEAHLPSSAILSQAASEGENPLSLAQQAALEQSLRDAAGEGKPAVSARFNADVLACLQNSELSQSAGKMVLTRLRWMALPALAGFVVMFGISLAWTHWLCMPPAPTEYAPRDTTAPPLPPLPVIASEPRPNAGTRAGAEHPALAWDVTKTTPPPPAQTPSSNNANMKGAIHVH